MKETGNTPIDGKWFKAFEFEEFSALVFIGGDGRFCREFDITIMIDVKGCVETIIMPTSSRKEQTETFKEITESDKCIKEAYETMYNRSL